MYGWNGKMRLGAKRTATGPEMIRKYEELYRLDPLITDTEVGQILNLKNRSSVIRLRRAFLAHLKAQNGEETPNLEVLDSWCLGENRIESEDLEPPPVPVKVKKTGRCHCLACFQQFDEVIPVHRNVKKLEENLKMIFTFKFLLDMTSDEMEEIMRSATKGPRHEGHPSAWVIFCEDCQSLVDEAMTTQREIQKLEKKMKGFKDEIIQRMWDTSGLRFKSKNTKGSKSIKYAGLTKKVREMIFKRDRVISEPVNFEEGDKEAEMKALALIPTEIVVKQEQEVGEELEDPVDHLVEFSCDLIKNEDGAVDNKPEAEPHSAPSELGTNFLEQFPNRSSIETDSVFLPTTSDLQSAPPELRPNFLDELLGGTSVETNTVLPVTSHGIGDILEPLRDNVSAADRNSTLLVPPMPTVTQGICDVCGVEMRPFAIPMHKLMEHDIVMEGYTAKYCEEEGCNYKTLFDTKFRIHMKVHSDNRPYNCSYCGKGFAKLGQVKNHEEIHKNAETRPYQCGLCGSSFAVKNYLYLHKRMSHEKRFFPSTNRKRPKE